MRDRGRRGPDYGGKESKMENSRSNEEGESEEEENGGKEWELRVEGIR